MTTLVARSGTAAEIGGKAASLAALADAGMLIPPWFVVRAGETESRDMPHDLEHALCNIAPNGELVAVRSSAVEEDSAAHSFAGQYESYLFVSPRDVPNRIRDLWNGAASDRVEAYRRERGLEGEVPLPAALIQRMIDPDVSGVAFSADPVSGRRGICVIAATYGVGTAIVSGDVDADRYHVDRHNHISERHIAAKRSAHRRGDSSIVEEHVADALATRSALNDADILRVAALARATERHFGKPQDIEWAIAGGELYLLQSRPITSMSALEDPDGEAILWDHSNIVESYGGVTTPLTFSFARYVYEHVYREFCRMLRVPERCIAHNSGELRCMLGLVQGRVYYNLVSWYRILALLPGYRVNRAFMEQMMGVKESLPEEIAIRIASPVSGLRAQIVDGFALLRTIAALVKSHRAIDATIAAFYTRLNDALDSVRDLSMKRPDELVADYRRLERALLTRWDAPLLNDFLAMIFFGVLRKLCATWCDDTNETLQNDLVSGDGTVVSAEPARLIIEMASLVRGNAALINILCDGSPGETRAAIAAHPALHAAFTAYLQRFGDRCLEELKLETLTLNDDPQLLAQSVGRVARAQMSPSRTDTPRLDIRGAAEQRALHTLKRRPLRRMMFRWVLRHARHRIRDRENLRFERTRVFGHVRRIFVELGRRYAALDALHDARDVFYLTVDEALGWPSGECASSDLDAVATARKLEFAQFHDMPAPPERFITRGAVHVGTPVANETHSTITHATDAGDDPEQRRGTGCYPGIVKGRVRVVRDPRTAVLQPGEILVAERTDPGWVMLFPAASGLLVERGSLLSHSAIVARELGLPAVVSIAGLTSWLRTGDDVELDGRTGIVRRTSTVIADGIDVASVKSTPAGVRQ